MSEQLDADLLAVIRRQRTEDLENDRYDAEIEFASYSQIAERENDRVALYATVVYRHLLGFIHAELARRRAYADAQAGLLSDVDRRPPVVIGYDTELPGEHV